MEIPNLPTDKFYKFLTVSGLFMIVVSLAYLFIIQQNSERKNDLIESSKLEVESYFLQKEIEEILHQNPEINKIDEEGIVFELISGANYLTRTIEEKDHTFIFEHYRTDSTAIKATVQKLNSLSKKKVLAEVQAHICDYNIISLAHDRQIASILLYISSLIGLLFCLWGFRMWYRLEVKKKKSRK